jgi:hypothetical protein
VNRNTAEMLQMIQDTRKELTLMEAQVRRADSCQWDRAPRSRSNPQDVRSRGGHADPVGDTVIDGPRLAVRDSMVRAALALRSIQTAASEHRHRMSSAVARWEGV